MAAGLVAAAGGEGQNVSGILAFADSEPIALRWGEVIPLTFFKSLFEGKRNSRVAVLSVPTRR
jgi:aromatic ring-opening dioxygenase LigB subunit